MDYVMKCCYWIMEISFLVKTKIHLQKIILRQEHIDDYYSLNQMSWMFFQQIYES